ncbi:MAG: biopolymer transporter ExbD [Candidatus Latescibacteria bacterium]|nr:biopolymer transporter ExbD [Candidatus Latescibacterota bacterium]
MKIKAHSEAMTTFNAISLTDIIFLLLVFFLLSSTFVLQPGVKVQLPTTTSTDISSEKSVVVSVTKEGAIYLNDNLVNKIELGAQLRQMVINVGNPILVLRADKAVTIESLVEVMDIAKTAGGERFVIATSPKE